MKIGILGCAAIAKRYAIPAFKNLGVDITVASRDPEKARAWAQELSINSATSYDNLLQSDIDAVYIPLPIGMHEEWILKAAEAGKHIICEKSITNDYASAKNVVDACKQARIMLYENFVCNFHPQHEKITSLIASNTIGEPLIFNGAFIIPHIEAENIRYNKALGGGALNDVGCYPVYMARKMFSTEPTSVFCSMTIDPTTKVDIEGTALLEFNGKWSFASFGLRAAYQNRYEILGRSGKILTNNAYSVPPDKEPIVEIHKNINRQDAVESIPIAATNQFALSFSDALSNLNSTTAHLDYYTRILKQAKILEAMRLSANQGKKMELSKVQ